MSYIPDQGDIVWIDFNPSAGKEIMKTRPALVASKKAFNDATGFAIVVPITNTERGQALEVVLDDRVKTTGVAVIPQVRSLDFTTRRIAFIEKAPQDVIKAVAQRIHLITTP